MNRKIDQIKQLYVNQGMLKYGENVTQTEHAVQCWYCAKAHREAIRFHTKFGIRCKYPTQTHHCLRVRQRPS